MPGIRQKFLKKLGLSSTDQPQQPPPPIPPHPVWFPAPQAPPWNTPLHPRNTSHNYVCNYNNYNNNNPIMATDQERPIASSDLDNGTYIRLARLRDGTILAGYTWREAGRMDTLRILKIARSTDNGATFHNLSEVVRGHGEIDNIHLLEVEQDSDTSPSSPHVLLAAFRNHDFGHGRAGDLEGITHYRLTVYESLDAGANWRFLSHAAEKSLPAHPPREGPALGIWEPFMRNSMFTKGEVQLVYSKEFAADDQRTMMVVSHDKGRTWSTPPQCVVGDNVEQHGHRLRDGMTGITQTFDTGRTTMTTTTGCQMALVMVFETTRYAPHFNIEAVVSYDDGISWQDRHEVYVPHTRGHNAGAPQIAAFGDGSLACVFMTDDDAETVSWIHNAAIKVCFGTAPHNGRIEWSKPVVVSPASSFWPGIMALDERRALVTYEHGGPKGRTIERPI